MGGEGHAVVTGVSAGIGRQVAAYLLEDGWTVYGLSRREPEVSAARFHWCRCDITDAPAVAELASRLPAALDVVVHNAAISGAVGPGLDLDLAAWRAAFEVNFFAPLNLTRQLVQRCRRNACFVFLSGGGAVTARPRVGPYAVSKLAVIKLAEQLALEYPDYRFYALAPGAHDTGLFEEQHRLAAERRPPFAKFEEVARLLRTLIADGKRRLNGKLIHIRDDIEQLVSVRDGGLVRRVERR